MRPPLDGVVLLTGASAGIGADMARQIAPTASHLILVARRRDRLEALATELKQLRPALTVDVEPCDLSTPSDVEALLARLPDVDVLINNAGLGDMGLFEDSTTAKIDQMIQVNVVALTRLTHALLPGMVARKRGGVLNVSSSYGFLWTPGAAVYIGTKHYVTAFTESLRSELRGTGVVVTQLCPGPVESEFEEVAGSLLDQKPPRFVMLPSAEAARHALDAFRADHALVISGWIPSLVLRIAGLTPRWLNRLMMAPMARMLRQHHDQRRR